MSCPPSTSGHSVVAGVKRLLDVAFPQPVLDLPSFDHFIKHIDMLESSNEDLHYQNHALREEKNALANEVAEATLSKAAITTLRQSEHADVQNDESGLKEVVSGQKHDLPSTDQGYKTAEESLAKIRPKQKL